MSKINIAIDGPAGAGKSTIAKQLADFLHYIYIDTGAMYRALTWAAQENKVDVNDGEELANLLRKIKVSMIPTHEGQKVLVDGKDVTQAIRSREVTQLVSHISGFEPVRKEMLSLQQELAKPGGVVMDGRDIGTHVLPDAEVKIFLSASISERAKRRFLQMEKSGRDESLAEIEEEIRLRDERDQNRPIAPLKKADDAIEMDTTGLSIDQVLEKIKKIVALSIEGGE